MKDDFSIPNESGRVKFGGESVSIFGGESVSIEELPSDCEPVEEIPYIERDKVILYGESLQRIREFPTGATRDTDDGKYDYIGFFSHEVMERFAEYMHSHRIQSDGKLRNSDNWKAGIPLDSYMESKFRHFMDTWKWHEVGNKAGGREEQEESLCAELFNTMGYLHEILQK